MTADRRLVAKGTNEPMQALLDQGRYHVMLAEQHAEVLTEHNWQAQNTAEMAAEIVALDTEKIRRLDEQGRAKETTRNEREAIAEAKALINKVRSVARLVVRKNPDAGAVVEDFHSGGPLGRASSKISAYLGKLRAIAAKLDVAFAPYLKQQLLSKLIDDARAKLDAASATQETDIAGLPEDTAAVYERKGRLLEHIEDLNAIAKVAFHDEPEIRGKFNKDILNRGRSPKKGSKPTEPSPTPS